MSAFTNYTTETAPEKAKETLKTVEKKYGFLPNLMGHLAESNPVLEAYITLGDKLAETTEVLGRQWKNNKTNL